jgi:hypothetical protein
VALVQSKFVAQPGMQAPWKQIKPTSQSVVSLQAPSTGGGGGLATGGGGGEDAAGGGGGGEGELMQTCAVVLLVSHSWPAGQDVAVQTHLPLVAHRGSVAFCPWQKMSPR